jgi:5-methylcytosine-specific restriction endonuclease McrA
VAHVVDPEDFRLYTWSEWSRLTPREGEPAIRTVRFRLRAPEVLTLVRHDKPRQNAVTFSRRNVFKRDHATCQYCGSNPGTEALTIDHIIPRSQGGQTTWENCALACVGCNARKANRTPEQAGMRLRRVPTRPVWKPLYDASAVRVASWARFLSDGHANSALEESA